MVRFSLIGRKPCTVRAVAAVRKGDDYDVIPSLMDVLSDAVEKTGRTKKDLAFVLGLSPKTVGRYFEWEHFPNGDQLDRVVAAASVLSGEGRFALWRAAVKKAEGRVRELGSDPQIDAAASVLALPSTESD
jgi:hypothetical protein